MAVLKLNQLRKRFGDLVAVDGLSLEIKPGQPRTLEALEALGEETSES